jgi:hypothetical protein
MARDVGQGFLNDAMGHPVRSDAGFSKAVGPNGGFVTSKSKQKSIQSHFRKTLRHGCPDLSDNRGAQIIAAIRHRNVDFAIADE